MQNDNKLKSKLRWEWRDGQWWVGLDAATKMYSLDAEPINGTIWVTYDDLCEAFPGLQDLATPA